MSNKKAPFTEGLEEGRQHYHYLFGKAFLKA